MTPDEAREAARSAARAFDSGEMQADVLFRTFMGLLRDICRDGLLSGDYRTLFDALSFWEGSVGEERTIAEARLSEAAKQLGGA